MEIPNGIKYFAIIQNVVTKEKKNLSKIANPQPRKERNARANLTSQNLKLVCSLSLTLNVKC